MRLCTISEEEDKKLTEKYWSTLPESLDKFFESYEKQHNYSLGTHNADFSLHANFYFCSKLYSKTEANDWPQLHKLSPEQKTFINTLESRYHLFGDARFFKKVLPHIKEKGDTNRFLERIGNLKKKADIAKKNKKQRTVLDISSTDLGIENSFTVKREVGR